MNYNMKKTVSAIMSAVIGLSLFVMPAARAEAMDGWDIQYVGNINATVEIDNTEAYRGKSSLKAVNNTGKLGNVYLLVSTATEMEEGTPYVVSVKAKSKASTLAYAMFNWESSTIKDLTQFGSTYDWKNYEWV